MKSHSEKDVNSFSYDHEINICRTTHISEFRIPLFKITRSQNTKSGMKTCTLIDLNVRSSSLHQLDRTFDVHLKPSHPRLLCDAQDRRRVERDLFRETGREHNGPSLLA